MKLKFLLLACLLLTKILSVAQQIETFNGKSFTKKQEKWYDSNGYEVNPKVITVRFKKNVSTDYIKYGKLLRANQLGFKDIEVPPNIDVVSFPETDGFWRGSTYAFG